MSNLIKRTFTVTEDLNSEGEELHVIAEKNAAFLQFIAKQYAHDYGLIRCEYHYQLSPVDENGMRVASIHVIYQKA